MQRTILRAVILVMALTTVSASAFAQESPAMMGEKADNGRHWLVGEMKMGYYSGVGFHMSATAQDFARGFPFAVRVGLGYSRVDSGDEWAARRIFIDNNRNGTARSDAHVWDVRMDLIYPIKLLQLERSQLYFGPRRSDFDAFFEYIGGAETFSVISKQWGLGGGLESAFALSPVVDMVFTLGADYYFKSTLSGHDTYYRPDGDHTHPIADYTYADADKAIAQPDVLTRLMVGLAYHF